jgi:beta-glucanase (GH16 family)
LVSGNISRFDAYNDLSFRGTNNLEWYSPDMITTSNGALNITLANQSWKGLDYKGGMLSSWNKFCFTGGYFTGKLRISNIRTFLGTERT